ncbi:hypothetical protein B0I35DRAFT_81981 [Stachybotrys elegans]|uniref:Uncharacterized protein n=1 Tax=Stachybotrys elegans TaxID=80388 RepID=A0A8K0WLW9_9HYPO|nr:hypothetical protein B0I35DRAFT_81981 [Stachybotrys elegans]
MILCSVVFFGAPTMWSARSIIVRLAKAEPASTYTVRPWHAYQTWASNWAAGNPYDHSQARAMGEAISHLMHAQRSTPRKTTQAPRVELRSVCVVVPSWPASGMGRGGAADCPSVIHVSTTRNPISSANAVLERPGLLARAHTPWHRTSHVCEPAAIPTTT